jgi:hypothetical protein
MLIVSRNYWFEPNCTRRLPRYVVIGQWQVESVVVHRIEAASWALQAQHERSTLDRKRSHAMSLKTGRHPGQIKPNVSHAK